MKRSLSLFLCLLLCLSYNMIAFADHITGDKEAQQTELTPDQRVTDITLSLASDEYVNKYDIVFVLDSSGSTFNSEYYNNIIHCASELFQSFASSGAEIKVGVIKFAGIAADAILSASKGAQSGLIPYSEDSASLIESAFRDLSLLFYRCTNLHAGLEMADDMLSADTEVPDSNKYVIMLTNGKSNSWNNEAGDPTCFYSQY